MKLARQYIIKFMPESDTDQFSKKKLSILGIGVNTILTGLILFIVTLLGYINTVQNRANHDDTMAAVKDLKLDVIGGYVSKVDFQTTVSALSATDGKLWEKESATTDTMNKNIGDINLKLQHIEDSLPKK